MAENKYMNRPTSRSAKRRKKVKFRTRRTILVIITLTLLIAFVFGNNNILLYATFPLSLGWIIGELLNL